MRFLVLGATAAMQVQVQAHAEKEGTDAAAAG